MGVFNLLTSNYWTTLILIFVLRLVVRHRKILWITLWTLPRDAKLLFRAAKFAIGLRWDQWTGANLRKVFEKVVKKHPNKVCFYAGDEEWTFQQVDDLANKIANYYAAKGFKKGDVIALFMDNRAEYPCIWLGLSKIGVITALINYNLRLDSLRHCVKVANATALIYGKKLAPAVKEVMDEGGFKDIDLYSFDSGSTPSLSIATDLSVELKKVATTIPPQPSSPVGNNDKLCYVYTSGTTGLPKAAVMKHNRFFMLVSGLHTVAGCRDDDVMLTPLPLYHTAGGIIAVGQAFVYSSSVVILEKFSASRFWDDCIRYKATASVYLGELCRFLLAQPKKAVDNQHSIRLLMGGGLRADIWPEFVSRFNIPELVECYASTEGNCGMSNIVGYPGACGFLPPILMPFLPMALVRVDDAGEPIRDPATGLGIMCQANEIGELMATISNSSPLRDFPGYTDAGSSNKKIMKDVFKKGDSCFRTGDVMVRDEYGYFYFRDRTGDTFRWKAENVSTMEVEAIVNRYCGLKDVAVYGVEMPGADGRAGMAAISDPDGSLDWSVLEAGIAKSLPVYARPVFIRILTGNVELTGTYKLKKVDLQKEGIDLSLVKDKIYILQGGKYIPLTPEIHAKVISGQLRL